MLKLLQRKLAKEGISVLTVLDELKHVYKLIPSEEIEKTVATTKIQKKILKIKKLRNSGDYSTKHISLTLRTLVSNSHLRVSTKQR